jgi:hypothetical protein
VGDLTLLTLVVGIMLLHRRRRNTTLRELS